MRQSEIMQTQKQTSFVFILEGKHVNQFKYITMEIRALLFMVANLPRISNCIAKQKTNGQKNYVAYHLIRACFMRRINLLRKYHSCFIG